MVVGSILSVLAEAMKRAERSSAVSLTIFSVYMYIFERRLNEFSNYQINSSGSKFSQR